MLNFTKLSELFGQFVIYFLPLPHILLKVENKIIDESKQGEALMVDGTTPGGKKLFLESYGCQMNFADSEIVASILTKQGFTTTQNYKEADVIFVNTCAIRENA